MDRIWRTWIRAQMNRLQIAALNLAQTTEQKCTLRITACEYWLIWAICCSWFLLIYFKITFSSPRHNQTAPSLTSNLPLSHGEQPNPMQSMFRTQRIGCQWCAWRSVWETSIRGYHPLCVLQVTTIPTGFATHCWASDCNVEASAIH